MATARPFSTLTLRLQESGQSSGHTVSTRCVAATAVAVFIGVGQCNAVKQPERSGPSEHPNVLIIGGGFGGLAAAKVLRRAPVRVTLLDRHNYHLFQPLLYQVATAALSPGDIASPIRWIFRSAPNVRVLLGEAAAI